MSVESVRERLRAHRATPIAEVVHAPEPDASILALSGVEDVDVEEPSNETVPASVTMSSLRGLLAQLVDGAAVERDLVVALGSEIEALETPEPVTPADLRAALTEAVKSGEAGDKAAAVKHTKTAKQIAAALAPPDPSLVLGVRPLDVDATFAPLAPIEWVTRELHLGPGRSNMLLGYSGSAKSLAALHVCIAVAAGRPIFGQFRTGLPRRVRYLSVDSGTRAARGRVQRIARGMSVTPEDLRGLFEIVPRPKVMLTDKDALAAYIAAALGVDLLVLDAFRGFIPGLSENDSEVRAYIDLLTDVSEATGCTVLLLHHEGKSGGARSAKPGDEAGRGSSAIQDACGAVLRIIREEHDGAPMFAVAMTKDAEEPPSPAPEPFFFRLVDVEAGDDPRGGLALEYRTTQQVKPPAGAGARLDAQLADALAFIESENRQQRGVSTEALAAGLGVDHKKAKTLRDVLEERGAIVDRPVWERGPKPRWWATSLAPPETSTPN